MSHPEWVLKHKQKNSEIRLIRGRYYLYQITSKWDPEKKRTKKVTLGMIGTITEQGLIPKGTKREKKNKITDMPKSVEVKEYGASNLLQNISNDIVDKLKEIFPLQFQEIITLAIHRLMYQAPLKNMKFLYEESFLSEVFSNLDLSKNALTELFKSIGSNRSKITDFMKSFVDGSEHLVFDTTHVISNSKHSSMNQIGYNSQGSYDPQVNLFYVFSTDKKMPVYFRLFPGNISGMKALKICIEEAEINNSIVIGDKGFCSENNLQNLEETRLKFILPLKRNYSKIDYTRLSSRDYDQSFDGHFFYHDRPIFYYIINLEDDSSKRIIVFFDKNLSLDEDTSYLKRVSNKDEGYDMDGYKSKQFQFGTISMITNASDLNPESVYTSYKSRMEVETVFDTYKNLLEADRTYMHSDLSMHTWTFINHISLMMYYKICSILKEAKMLSSISPADLLLRMSRINKLKINNNWKTAEINSKTTKILNKLNITVT